MVDTSPMSRLKYRSDADELQRSFFSIINEADPNRMSKKLHLKNWCRAFLSLFIKEDEGQNTYRRDRLPFFLDVLADEECWVISDTIHRVNLNRRIAAKKIVQSQSRSGIPNPLDFQELYRVACSCCLEEDIAILFENFKQNGGIKSDDAAELNKLVAKELSKGCRSDPLIIYWSYIMGGLTSELQEGGKHLYETGLEQVYVPYVAYVEAVEFFWNKIKSLPVNELSDEQKYEIFIKTALSSSVNRIGELAEVLEFCLRQMTPNMYSDFLDREYAEYNAFVSLGILRENLCFDLYQELFQYVVDPRYRISEKEFYLTLQRLAVPDYSENYASVAVPLFMHMWISEAGNQNFSYVLDQELRGKGTLLESLVQKNHMDLAWAILAKENPDQIKKFMTSIKAERIITLLRERGDKHSLNRFLSHNYAIRQPDQSASSMEVDDDVATPSPTKKQKVG